ncbi:hypothetical protein ABKA04_003469 [Annulohypoxylon sp. FPYF3050]
MKTCWGMYAVTKTGLAPEIAWFNVNEDDLRPVPGNRSAAPNKDSLAAWKRDYIIKPADAHNLQRPETVESLFMMWRITEDPLYREWGWKIFVAFEKHAKLSQQKGYDSVNDVNTVPSPTRDKMESFWLAETLKYVYLLFSPNDFIPLTEVVFNTEAHIFPVLDKVKWKTANVPGPFLARVSAIPNWYYAYRGDRHIWLWQQFQIYGDKIRPEPNTVLFCAPEALTDIYGMKSNVQRSKFYSAWSRNDADKSTLNCVGVAEHGRKRKLLNFCFTEKSIRAASDFIIKHVDRWNHLLVEKNGSDWSDPMDFSAKVDTLSFDIMAVQNYYQFIYDSVTNRIALQQEQAKKPESERRKDMFYFLCEARDPDTGLPAYDETTLRAEANLLIIAGSDATAVSLTSIFFYLTDNPYQYEKLVKEIRTTFETVGDIVYGPKLSSCTYLRACIDEGIRLSPAGPSEMSREVLPGGITINGEHFPEGTIVGTAQWVNSRSDIYGDPNVFRPERWIPDEGSVTQEQVARMRSMFHPFGAGPGNCVGKSLAMVEMMITVARTLHRLDVRRVPGSTMGGGAPELMWGARDKRQLQLVDVYISLRHGPEVQFRKRVD